ncbi:MAG: efflux RND transporter periplasmic adaptor subunit [Oscillospiraceae bacterium]|nr:efflux RND transporter periplasmic adaptor subunit [Oscillospiraceae bacterium]
MNTPKNKKIIIAVVIAVVLVSFIGFAIWNVIRAQNSSGIPKNAIPVDTELSHLETIVSKVSVKGAVELVDIETVFPQTSATVKKVYVKNGDEVTVGQSLLDYDDKTLDALKDQLADAELALKSAKLNLSAAQVSTRESDRLRLENARANYDNLKALFDAGAVSKQELDAAYETMIRAEDQMTNASSQRSVLQVTVEQTESKISQIQKEIDRYVESEVSPVDGTVIAVYVKEGDVSLQGRQLFDIADVSADNLTIKANVPENEARNLALGQDVEIRCNAIGQAVFHGNVSKISPVAEKKLIGNAQETALAVEFSFEEAPLKSGYSIDATIITRIIENAVVVPLVSVTNESDGNNYVYIMRSDYSVEKRLIDLGEYSGIFVEAGNVTEGEKVILNPSAQIKDGVFVKPIVFQNAES